MDAVALLLNRQSCPRLQAPAPSAEQLDIIFAAAARVPDHMGLQPYQFIVAEQEGLSKLGEIFALAAKNEGQPEEVISRAAQLPHRAPMVIVISAKPIKHNKVPEIEQVITAGCAAMAMQQAAFAQGLGAVWRTGSYAFNDEVKQALELEPNDHIVGFLYLGTQVISAPIKASKDITQQIRYL